jgi:hypothetical protein
VASRRRDILRANDRLRYWSTGGNPVGLLLPKALWEGTAAGFQGQLRPEEVRKEKQIPASTTSKLF